MVGEQPSTHEHELSRIVVEVGQAVGGLVDEGALVSGVAGQVAQSLEREHGARMLPTTGEQIEPSCASDGARGG